MKDEIQERLEKELVLRNRGYRARTRKTEGIDCDKGSSKTELQNPTKIQLADFTLNNLQILEYILMFMREIESLFSKAPTRVAAEAGSLDTIYSYTNDAIKAVPSEYALLAREDTKIEFLARFANHGLLTLQPSERKRFPVALMIDCSGSMKGQFYLMALAFVLAVVKKLHKDKRGAVVIQFSTKVEQVIVMTESKPFNLLELLSKLTKPSYGGTDFNPPIVQAWNIKLEQRWNSLVGILVSDGYGEISCLNQLVGKKSKSDKLIAALVSNSTTLKGVDELFRISKKGKILEFAKLANNVI